MSLKNHSFSTVKWFLSFQQNLELNLVIFHEWNEARRHFVIKIKLFSVLIPPNTILNEFWTKTLIVVYNILQRILRVYSFVLYNTVATVINNIKRMNHHPISFNLALSNFGFVNFRRFWTPDWKFYFSIFNSNLNLFLVFPVTS